jgi:hypothetical protein
MINEVEQVKKLTYNMNIEQLKKQLTFDLWNGDFHNTDYIFELECQDEDYAQYNNIEVYYGVKRLLELLPREEAVQWLENISNQIYEGKIKYEWNPETRKYIR